MPNYKILLFGITKDLLKDKYIVLQTEENLDTARLLDEIKKAFPLLQTLPSLRLAAEQRFPENDFMIEEHMEIALIPPVSGG